LTFTQQKLALWHGHVTESENNYNGPSLAMDETVKKFMAI